MLMPSTKYRPNWLFFLLFLARCSECTFNLDSFKSGKLIQLFMSHNLSLQFELQQKNQTEFDIFRVSHNNAPIFRIATSTIQNYILIEFQLDSGRRKQLKIGCPFLQTNDKFHKIIFVLEGQKISVAENCRQLYSEEDAELNGEFPATEMNIILDAHKSNDPELRLREFTADTAIQLEDRCPHLETIIDNPISREYLPNDPEQPKELEQIKREIEKHQSHHNKTMANEDAIMLQRIDELENQMDHWKQLFDRFENRIKRVELHQRGCMAIGGKLMETGQRIQNFTDCTECQCGLDSNLHCKPIGCPRLDCAHPIHASGRCCPQCGRKCFHNGKYYESGELFWPKQCAFCLCDDGQMQCGFKFPNNCPRLDCPEQETLPNQCCPVCINVDHCAPAPGRNPCSGNATCQSGKYSAKCRCNEGFFGNGTICTDVDECLWDKDARKQLGGCGEGTICINLPGSFKCECLPGYQKLDHRNCLDVIRI